MPSANFAPYTGPLNPTSMQATRSRRFVDASFSPANGPPVLQNVSPASGSNFLTNQPWSGQLVSPPGRAFAAVLLLVQYPLLGAYEVIYDGVNVASDYFCSVAPIPNGFNFTNVIRRGGWPATQINILMVAVDKGGLVNS